MSELDPDEVIPEPQASHPQAIVAAPPRHRIFIGPHGLRAGWSLGIYCLIVAAYLTIVHFVADAIHAYVRHGAPLAPAIHNRIFAPGPRILREVIMLLCALFAAWIMSHIEKCPFGEYGLGGNSRRWPQFLQGFCWGFAFISLLILGLYLGHYLVLTGFLHGL